LRKTLNASHTQAPTVMNVDKNAVYPPAKITQKTDEQRPNRQVEYLNKRVEQDHRNIARLTKLGMGFCSLGEF